MADTFQKCTISHEASLRIAEAAVLRARELGIAIVVAVLDENGLPKALCRMDGAPAVSIGAAQDKAFTALLGMPSGDLFQVVKDDPSLLATLPNTPRIALIAGGLPVLVNGALVGAVGVGGGSTAQDVDCATAGLRVLQAS
jgi:uncharacterized protein GlcG (DUF336 family)